MPLQIVVGAFAFQNVLTLCLLRVSGKNLAQEQTKVTTETHIATPKTYSEAIQLALMANRLCFVTFSCPDKDNLPDDIDIHKSFSDYCPEGIENYPCENIAIDPGNTDWHYVGKRIRDIIDKAKWDHDAVYVLLDMVKSICNKEISDLLTKLFAPVVEEKLDNFLLPPRVLNALATGN